MEHNKLAYDDAFWEATLGHNYTKKHSKHLLFSLLCYLNVSLFDFLQWTFSSDIASVRTRAGRFLGDHKTAKDEEHRFLPTVIFKLWHEKFGKDVSKNLECMLEPYARRIVLQESNAIIQDKNLQIRTGGLTQDSFEDLVTPGMLIEVYQTHAPFTWGLLQTFAASPNLYRKAKAAKAKRQLVEETEEPDEGFDDGEDLEEDPDVNTVEAVMDSGGGGCAMGVGSLPDGFSRNPVNAVLMSLSMMSFARNRATNALPLLCGLFFKIEGTSSRASQLLSNLGLCVSVKTVERVKEVVSKNCIESARSLMLSGHMQSLTGEERMRAKFTDILLTKEDDEHLWKACISLITEFIIRYTPGSEKWEGRAEMLKKVREEDGDAPVWSFYANEGSKKGIIELLDLIRQRATMEPEEWAGKVRVLLGDWLTSANFRHVRRDRRDDITPMEHLEYGEEVSQLFHFALQATQMIMRTHFGTAIDNPLSLSAHKGLLGRVWDHNTPNYAAAKLLIRHSLIARILHIAIEMMGLPLIRTILGFGRWSELAAWTPMNYKKVEELAEEIWAKWASTTAAEHAKSQNDDWAAHDIYFIRDALFFCAGQHNYARECAEILLRWKFELSDDLQKVLERSWFVNRWGKEGQWIAADLYLEQMNLLVKVSSAFHGNANIY
ncbi:hypothetical protein DFP72DRAFT_1140144 [Ephemerocybe angulata]|uniref:DUF6589 domain-containing protein n=1 Tax=Ephemerocybe angulata TaxID=980116 RepID=A0A8H6ID86_9AGAR|nr:hypothetical protein DFP72DRAFT_1140144 [Tulosesus angulatus]